jgi:hypothetical protein
MQALLQLKAAVAALLLWLLLFLLWRLCNISKRKKTCVWFNVEYFKSVVEYFKSPEYFPLKKSAPLPIPVVSQSTQKKLRRVKEEAKSLIICYVYNP